MSKVKILVVEDESIVAKDIQNTLIKLGYDVPATASNAVSAMEKVASTSPDLVFLDIKLKGDIDGIQIAEKIRENFNIPVIFLTSYVDKPTLDRAKVTEPYGYIVKPFHESDLQSTIEMALYKFQRDQETKDDKERFENALSSVDEGIILCDKDCAITYLNNKAENLVGYGIDTATGKDIFGLINIMDESKNETTKETIKSKLSNQKHSEITNAEVLFTRDGKKITFDITLSEVQDEKGLQIGYGLVLRDPGRNKEANSDNPMESIVVQNSFFVKKGSMLVKVFLENINYIQAMDNYVIIQTGSDQFVIHSTMKDLEQRLPSNKFLRVHRSYIIPLEKVNVLDENTVLIGDKTIPVGKSYKEAFMKRLNFL